MTSLSLCALAACAIMSAASANPANTRVIEVPASDAAVKLWTQGTRDAERITHYAIAFDGESFPEPRPASYELKLRYGAFTPLAPQPVRAVPDELAADLDTNLYLVQFITQPLESYREALRDLGAAVHAYVPNHAHVVRMNPEVRDDVQQLPFVRWIGPYHPAYRLEEALLDVVNRAADPSPAQTYNIMVFETDQKAAVVDRINEIGGIVDKANGGKYLLHATLSSAQLLEVARFDEVAFVDRWTPFETDMHLAREIGGANAIESVAGYTGEGVRGEVLDAGFNVDHVDFASRPLILHTQIDANFHGASTSGIIFGDGAGNPTARGMLPDGQGIVADYDEVGLFGQARFDLAAELLEEPYEAVFVSTSAGNQRTTQYTTISADMDALLFDLDILHLQSQSNAGNQDSRPQAWAKNIVSVGGVRHYNTLTKDDDCWCGGASIGPAVDGRIKPDLSHFYDNIFTVTTGSPTAYTSSFGGTSGATPIVAGHAGLFYEMWSDGVFGNLVDPDASVFDNRPRMTTAKAMLINTAAQYPFEGLDDDLTRTNQGWGLPDVQQMYDLREKMLVIDETDLLANGASTFYTVEVDPGEPAMRATLTWSDPPALPSSTQTRINDLTLRVTSPSGDIYWGNHGLREGVWSVPGGEADTIDTVENVFVEEPEAGQWIIEVFADEVNEDGHVETPQIDADFALVVSGVQQVPPPLVLRLLSVLPQRVAPGESVALEVQILPGEESIVTGTELMHYRFASEGPFTTAPLVDLGDGLYSATLPPASCGDEPEFFFSVEGDGGTVLTSPPNAPQSSFVIPEIGEVAVVFLDDFESDLGWTVTNSGGLTDGAWNRGVPVACGRGDPSSDADGSGQCYLTDNSSIPDCNSDVDDGSTTLTSPIMDASDPEAVLSYSRWYSNTFGADPANDIFVVEISDDGGATWTELETVGPGGGEVNGGWIDASFLVADIPGIENTDQLRVRFTASDLNDGSVVEAAIDAVRIDYVFCEDNQTPGDIDGDGAVGVEDLLILLGAWGDCPPPPAECPADVDGSGTVDVSDLLIVLGNWN